MSADSTEHLPLSLTLFVSGIFADDHHNALSSDNSTCRASFFD